MDKIKAYWNKGKKEKVILSIAFGVGLFIVYKILRGILKSRNSNKITVKASDQSTIEQPKASGLIYASTGTNTDVGYLNDEAFAGINKNFDVIQSDLSDLFSLQQMTIENLNDVTTDLNQKIDVIKDSQVQSENFTDRLYGWADDVTKFKTMYNNATNDDERRNASQGASRVRQIASNYAKRNNLDIKEVYYPNELLSGGGYTELIIEGISI